MGDFIKKSNRIHLIGIGGIGVSGLAKILIHLGKKISGSDNNYSPIIKKLRRLGIEVYIGQKEQNINSNIDLVIYSQAILPDNPEYKKAKELNIPVLSYPEAVGEIMREKRGIVVSGTHGKTTTSALVVCLLKSLKLSPSFLIGGEIINLGNSGVGKSDLLVVEGCEYKRSFLNYHPEIAIITNIEKDHLDYYKDINDIKSAFLQFTKNIKSNGILIYCGEDINLKSIAKNLKINSFSYGFGRYNITASNFKTIGKITEFDSFYNGNKLGKVKVNLWGRHNVLNSLSVIGVGIYLGLYWREIKKGLESFKGVHRRCEILGEKEGIIVIDDYGHHPTEIKATLKCIRDVFPNKRLIVVFQPHQYSRTRFLLKDFANSFSLADKVVVPDIYFVRDSLIEKKFVNSEILVEKIRKNGKEAIYISSFREIVEYLLEIKKEGDIILTIGAGPVDRVAKEFLKRLKK
ncbi:MAG: UDP-N-acetylmuramate--L-alanine ligase [Candidatus Omnitrophica bacterium]|nr:UDP-N-acetylmuramate--L-alanine ligase [Candidatus Omnitrophota bacterium]MCM8808566.1 UDP-N-acetylmuramate--L-alanine ligase [Candidatus Omnitrophota bacterium]MCM8810770.1 UDP-N-acetylmuramate--L-alanine ligase [Candidatus Omnitrophota bacterium]MCM8833438.1 UDP-N-acetylmuramate--L-alanine ligase [Candidatus Omnitrophota bacterium]